MEGCFCKKKGFISTWWKTSSFSTRLLMFIIPLMLVSLAVVLVFSSPNNNFYYSWSSSWGAGSSVFSSGRNFNFSESLLKGFLPGDDKDLEFRRRVVGGGDVEEAVKVDYHDLNSSTAMAEPPVEMRNDDLMLAPNESNVFPPPEDTEVPPSISPRIKKRFSNLEVLEAKLQRARVAIRDAQSGNGSYDPDYVPTGPIYWNPSTFHRSYLEMEKQFKVFVYEEGEQPIFHNGPCGSIYSMEGNFIYKLETSKFRTRDPEKAHVFFLPFSVASIVHFIYDKTIRDHWGPMKQTVKDYVDLVAGKYPYWNRSLGTDHFMLSCHDWGPELSKSVKELYSNSMRALCNANTSEGFRPSKDISIPEINLPGGRTNGLLGGPSPSKRPILVFFAGGLHGPIRPILLEHWENKDEDVQIHQYLPKGVSYPGMMRKSRFCICPSGYEVASPRMVEALYTGCVPVLIKDHYVAPFSDVLNWKSFSVQIPVEDIPNLKNILMGISMRQYIRMQRRGVLVRKHFEVNLPPKRYDVFHMTLHSIWLRRLNTRLHGVEDS